MEKSTVLQLANFLLHFRLRLLLASVVAGCVLGLGIVHTQFNTSLAELLSDNDPYLAELEEMAERFPTPSTLTVVFSGPGDSVFDQRTLAAIREFRNRYQELPGAERFSSLLEYRSPQTNFTLFERPSPDYSQEELSALERQALDDPILSATLLADQAGMTFVTVFTAIDESSQSARLQLADATTELLTSLRVSFPDVEILANSDPLFEKSTQTAMIQDLLYLLPFVILICVLTICYCFRSFIFGFCILSQALLAVISTVGVVGLIGISFNSISVIAPLIVVIISVAHSVHIISVFKRNIPVMPAKDAAMAYSIRHNLIPVLLATVTTAIGFLSLSLSSSPAIQDFGRIVSLGIGFAFIYTFTVLPALLLWASVGERGDAQDAVLPGKLIERVKLFWVSHERALFVVCSIMALSTLLLLPLNETDFNRTDFIQPETEVGQYYTAISNRIQRGPTLVYGIATDIQGAAIEPQFLHQVDEFSSWLQSQEEITGAASLVEVVKTIHLARGGQDPDYYSIPSDVYAIANDLNIYESIEYEDFPLANFIDEDFSSIRLAINAVPLSNQALVDLDQKISDEFNARSIPARLVHGSGIVIFARMDSHITLELIQGYCVSLILITLTLVIGFRSIYFGLLSVIPNLLPATMVFGIWGLLIGKLDPFVMMLFSISIGLVVDDTVHILSHYLHNRKSGLSVEQSFNQSLDIAGPALVVTTLVLALGTTILIAANTLYFQQAAKLLVPIVVLALVLDLLFLPTILKRLDRNPASSDSA